MIEITHVSAFVQVLLGGIRDQTTDKTKPESSASFTATSADKCEAGTEPLVTVRAALLDHPDDGIASVNGVLQLEQQQDVSGLCQVRLYRKILSLSTHFLLTDQQIKHPHAVSIGQRWREGGRDNQRFQWQL